MAATVRVDWKGDRLRARAMNIIRDELAAATERCVITAKSRVPVLTGRLQRSIRPAQIAAEHSRGVFESEVVADAHGDDGHPYGAAVEARKPYMEPALEQAGREVVDGITRKLRRLR